MSDIRFNRWLHQSGTGGVYQDSSGRVGIGTSVPTTALDVQSGTIKIGSNTLSSSGVSTFSSVTATTVTATSITGVSTIGVTTVYTNNIIGVSTAGITTAYIGSVNDGPISGTRNRIINGDMLFFQRGNVNVDAGGGITYVADRFGLVNYWGSGTVNTSQSTTAPSGYSNSLLLTVATAAPMSGSTGYSASLMQYIEGYNISDLYSSNVTLSFWVRSSITGTYSIQFSNATNGAFTTGDRIFVTNYTINVANTWEYKTVTISLSSGTSAGTWNKTNGNGLAIGWNLGAESNRKSNTALDTWYTALAGVYPFQSASQTNWISNSGATFYLTGVQVEIGTVATPFERRSYGQELALCQRYYQRVYVYQNSYAAQYSNNGNFYGMTGFFPTTMRATPSSLTYQGASGSSYWVEVGQTAFSANTTSNISILATDTTFQLTQARTAGNSTPTRNYYYMWEPSFFVNATAEL